LASKAGTQEIARRYATAFFDLAQAEGKTEQAAADFLALAGVLSSGREFASFLNNPILRRSQQAEALSAVAKQLKLSPLAEKFIGLLAQKRRLGALPEIAAAVQTLLSEHKGEVTAHVTAAQALDQAQISAISATLGKQLGKAVKVQLEIDPEIMGGLIIKVGSKLIDSSVRTKLDRLHRALKNSNESSGKAKMKEVA
jgi:F-type H+-transporting ATPase subunit delta